MPTVDLNADVGEGETPPAGDGPLLEVVTSASVACGGHAGNRAVMAATVAGAGRLGVAVGAHPSYLDREGFGRRPVQVDPRLLAGQLRDQVGSLREVADVEGVRVRYVKAHGALYNAMAGDLDLAATVAGAVRDLGGLALLVQAGTPAVSVAEDLGLEVFGEAFCDRAYLPDGRLLDRGEPGAVLTDPAAVTAQALDLALDHRVRTVEGSWLAVRADSLCLHGDTPGAAGLAAAVRRALEGAGVGLAPFAP